MSCLNNRRHKDINYVKTKAVQFSKIVKKEVAVFQTSIAGIGKVYDFIEMDKCQIKPLETIKYKLPVVDVRKYTSPDVLRNSGKSAARKTDNKKKKANKSIEKDGGEPLVSDTGNVLREDKPSEAPNLDNTTESKESEN
jgi:hypothetical protein